MTVDDVLKIIAENYLYFQHKRDKAVIKEEYNMFDVALQAVYCIIRDIDRKENCDIWGKVTGITKN